jgi:hypothetical protein
MIVLCLAFNTNIFLEIMDQMMLGSRATMSNFEDMVKDHYEGEVRM